MPSVARLKAETHESITITFDAEYRPATPGSSAWSIIAKNLHVDMVIPSARPHPHWALAKILARTTDPNPYALIDEYVVLQEIDPKHFGGAGPFSLLIRAGEQGQEHAYRQKIEFASFYRSYDENDFVHDQDTLIDPVNQTSRFQTDLFQASPYARADMGTWLSI
jgi:hypothetical protein